MRIALFHNLPSGGAKRLTYEQVRELTRRGHEVVEYTLTSADGSYMVLSDLGITSHVAPYVPTPLKRVAVPGVSPYVHLVVNTLNLYRLRRLQAAIAAQIDQLDYDVVLVEDCRYTVSPFLLSYLRTPSVFYAHSLLERRCAQVDVSHRDLKSLLCAPPRRVQTALVLRAQKHGFKSATRVLTNSYFTRDLIRAETGVTAHVVYPGVDIVGFSPEAGPKGDYVLSVGSLSPAKGHDLIIRALALIPKRLRPRLVIAAINGPASVRDDLMRLASEQHVALSIVSADTTQAMAALYAGAILLAAASYSERLGLAPLEAMACGTPVVAVREGGFVETIVDGETGFLVDRTARSLADAMQRLLVDPVLATQMGLQGRSMIEQRWTWKVAVDNLEKHLYEVGQMSR